MVRKLALLMICLSGLCGCGSSLSPVEREGGRFAAWSDGPVPYRFEDGDELDVKLLYNPEFSDRVQVGPDGLIHLQLVGAVMAGGKTPEELAQWLKRAYAVELRRPDVAVVPRSYGSQSVFVGGEVQRPGPVPLRGESGILQAIIGAGSFTSLAYQDEVVLIRRSRQNTPMLKLVNVHRLLEGDFNQDVRMARYDVVYVPRSHIADVDQAVDQWINQVLPFQKGFSYTISTGSTTSRTVQ